MSVLVLNAGSATLKFSVLRGENGLASGVLDWKRDPGPAEVKFRVGDGPAEVQRVPIAGVADGVGHVLRLLGEAHLTGDLEACGHRVVHGGAKFRASTRIDAAVKQHLRELCGLAPLHNPPALAGIDAAEAAFPGLPHVAVFDTAFFADQPPGTFLYPLPYAWYTDWGIRRFGFHGISHQYCARRAGELLGRADARLVICHLGNGCSASAVRGGTAAASTMGYTPLEGLMMGTRCGSVDPGILVHVLKRGLVSVEQLDQALQHESGLLGVSGVSSDYRAVEQAADAGDDERAVLALGMFADRVRAAVGALVVQLGGMDALVFTAGIGENSARLRAEVCRGLDCLGIQLDHGANLEAVPDVDVAARGNVLVIRTREELMIAREVRNVV